MGILHPFRKRDGSSRHEDLLQALLDAVERQDVSALMALINENSDAIRTQFRSWTKVPESIRNDPTALDRYGRTLFTVASLFDREGDSSLMECLTGRDRDNPIAEWVQDLERADSLISNGQATEAVPLLRAMLELAGTLSGPAVGPMRARALGRLGIALSKTGDSAEAIRVTREALELCEQAGDKEGIKAYQTNLTVLGAYEIAQRNGTGRRLVVVFFDSNGNVLTPEDLSTTTGTIRWEVRFLGERNREAERLHDEGRAAGAKGDYDVAISLLTQAADLDPAWAYPIYDRAYSHLLKQDFDAALADYRKALELCPQGFFLAAQNADMLAREMAGEFPRGLSLPVAMLADMPREQQQSAAEQLTHKFPSCAVGWDIHVNFIKDPAVRLAAIESGLAARPDADTRGSLFVKKAMALEQLGETARAIEILKPLTEHIGDSISTHAKAYVMLAVIRGKHGNVS